MTIEVTKVSLLVQDRCRESYETSACGLAVAEWAQFGKASMASRAKVMQGALVLLLPCVVSFQSSVELCNCVLYRLYV